MVGDNTKNENRSPLLPDRTRQGDFFVCDIFDAAPKGDMASMEHPIFSLSTKPDTRIRRYESGQNFVEVTPSVKGLATVHDRDILIFCISQYIAAMNRGDVEANPETRPKSIPLRLRAHELLQATNRGTDGRAYEQLKAALERLAGTQIQTNVTTDNVEELDGFGLIDRYKLVRETRDGRMQELEITLSEWVSNAIYATEVLTLSRNYFRLRKPLERRLYELVRKQCGQKSEWRIGLEKLKDKCGSNSTSKEFRRLLRKIIEDDKEHNHLPDYSFEFAADMFIARPKADFAAAYAEKPNPAIDRIYLKQSTYEKAREAAPAWDVHYLESEWRNWIKTPPDKPDAAFIGFCKKWFEKRGRPS